MSCSSQCKTWRPETLISHWSLMKILLYNIFNKSENHLNCLWDFWFASYSVCLFVEVYLPVSSLFVHICLLFASQYSVSLVMNDSISTGPFLSNFQVSIHSLAFILSKTTTKSHYQESNNLLLLANTRPLAMEHYSTGSSGVLSEILSTALFFLFPFMKHTYWVCVAMWALSVSKRKTWPHNSIRLSISLTFSLKSLFFIFLFTVVGKQLVGALPPPSGLECQNTLRSKSY